MAQSRSTRNQFENCFSTSILGIAGIFLDPSMPETNIFVEQYGEPTVWQCPDCGCICTIFPALPFEHVCSKQFRHKPKCVYYVMGGDSDSGKLFFCVTGDYDPDQSVHVMIKGERAKLKKQTRGDLVIWRIPPEYDSIHGIDWQYDRRLQFGMRMPEKVQQQFAAQHKHSA